MSKTYFLLRFLLLLFIIQSCTFTRIGVFMMPNVSDYKVFPTDTLKADPYPSPAYVEAAEKLNLPEISRWIPESYRKSETDLDKFLKQSKTTALLIMRNDSLIYERYANGHEREQPQIIFSISKAIMAMLTAIAIEEGAMKLHQKVADFIPEYGKDSRKHITIHHLLNMVSGIDFDDEQNFINLAFFYYSTNQDKFVRNFDAIKYPPNEHFAYNSMATQVLAMCLEKATGKKMIHYLKEKIWQPLGMEYDALLTVDGKAHNHRAFGGIAMRSRDLIRLGRLLLNKGKWNGKQILPISFVQHLTKRKIPNDTYWAYQNCFWFDGYVHDHFLTDSDFFAAGFYGQFLYVNPDLNMVIVRQGKKETFLWRFVLGRLAQEVGGSSNDLTNPQLNYSADFEGVYKTDGGDSLEIVFIDKHKKGAKKWLVVQSANSKIKADVMDYFDGKCIGYRTVKTKNRIMFDITDSKLQGLYYDYKRAIRPKYYKKKSTLSKARKHNLLKRFK